MIIKIVDVTCGRKTALIVSSTVFAVPMAKLVVNHLEAIVVKRPKDFARKGKGFIT